MNYPIDDATLLAYLDHDIDEPTATTIESTIAAESTLYTRLLALRQLHNQLQIAYTPPAPVADEVWATIRQNLVASETTAPQCNHEVASQPTVDQEYAEQTPPDAANRTHLRGEHQATTTGAFSPSRTTGGDNQRRVRQSTEQHVQRRQHQAWGRRTIYVQRPSRRPIRAYLTTSVVLLVALTVIINTLLPPSIGVLEKMLPILALVLGFYFGQDRK